MSASIRTSSRLGQVKPSITLAVTAKAAELRAQGKDIVSFGAGEPDFDTPEHIKDAVRKSMEGRSKVGKYTAVGGTPELRAAVATHLGQAHGFTISPQNVLVSTGAKHSLFNLFMAMLNEGDEVLIPAPYWVSYPDMVLIAGGTPVILPTTAEDEFLLEPEAMREAITPRTRALVLNSPSNPTGMLYDRARLEAIASIALEHNLIIVSDDIYRSLVYGGALYHSIASLAPEVAARTVLIDGVSKAYAMTGWRIGYAAGPAELIKTMATIQGQSTSNPTHIAQVAAMAALTGPQECVEEMRLAFDERRKEMVALLRAIPGVTCIEPTGAFYAFPNVSAYLGKKTPAGQVIADDVALCDHLVTAAGVAVVPGSGFGAPGFVRLSYACSMSDIRTGIGRLHQALTALA